MPVLLFNPSMPNKSSTLISWTSPSQTYGLLGGILPWAPSPLPPLLLSFLCFIKYFVLSFFVLSFWVSFSVLLFLCIFILIWSLVLNLISLIVLLKSPSFCDWVFVSGDFVAL